jgi:SAM-dependent methyltransferase
VNTFKKVYIAAANHLIISKPREVATLKRFLQIQKTDTLLDVGCGPGFWTWKLSEKCHRAIGVDLNQEEVAAASRVFQGERCDFAVSKGESLPFAHDSFDKVISICVLEHIPSDISALREINRVLKMDGLLAISVDSLSNPCITNEERESHAQQHSVHNFYGFKALETRLKEAGFDVLKHEFLFVSNTAFRIHRIFWYNRHFLFPLYPFVWAAISLSELFKPKEQHGFILTAQARKCRGL